MVRDGDEKWIILQKFRENMEKNIFAATIVLLFALAVSFR